MEVFKIDGADFTDIVQSYTTGYNVLLSEKSGRTARGNNVVDIVNRKTKLTVSFLPMDAVRMKAFLAAIEPYVVDITYWDAKTDALKTMEIYTGTPEVTALRMNAASPGRRYGSFSLAFVEM